MAAPAADGGEEYADDDDADWGGKNIFMLFCNEFTIEIKMSTTRRMTSTLPLPLTRRRCGRRGRGTRGRRRRRRRRREEGRRRRGRTK